MRVVRLLFSLTGWSHYAFHDLVALGNTNIHPSDNAYVISQSTVRYHYTNNENVRFSLLINALMMIIKLICILNQVSWFMQALDVITLKFPDRKGAHHTSPQFIQLSTTSLDGLGCHGKCNLLLTRSHVIKEHRL